MRVLHVRQELHTENEDTTVLQAVLESDVERNELLRQEKEIVARLENQDDSITGSGGEELTVEERRKKVAELNKLNAIFADDLKKLNEVHERLQLLGADTALTRAATILSGLQFSPDMQSAPIKSLSGGWRMRVALAAALLIEPDILMLDEPTNHLDLEAVIWLERYLQEYPHTVILVSHDRGFLNEVTTDTIEFKNKKLTCKSASGRRHLTFQNEYTCLPTDFCSDYRGNFDMYVKLRDEKIKNVARVYEAYQSKRAHMMEFIDKFRGKPRRCSTLRICYRT